MPTFWLIWIIPLACGGPLAETRIPAAPSRRKLTIFAKSPTGFRSNERTKFKSVLRPWVTTQTECSKTKEKKSNAKRSKGKKTKRKKKKKPKVEWKLTEYSKRVMEIGIPSLPGGFSNDEVRDIIKDNDEFSNWRVMTKDNWAPTADRGGWDFSPILEDIVSCIAKY